MNYNDVNLKLIQMHNDGNERATGKLYLANRLAVMKKFGAKYENMWLEGQAYIEMCACLTTFDPEKSKFITHFITRLKWRLPWAWERDNCVIKLPYKLQKKKKEFITEIIHETNREYIMIAEPIYDGDITER